MRTLERWAGLRDDTSEYHSPGTSDIEGMSPRVFQVEEGQNQQQDLDLWVIR